MQQTAETRVQSPQFKAVVLGEREGGREITGKCNTQEAMNTAGIQIAAIVTAAAVRLHFTLTLPYKYLPVTNDTDFILSSLPNFPPRG